MVESCDRHCHPLSMLTCPVFSPTDTAAWKLCVCVKRTRSTARMKRELWHPSTRRRGGNERIRSLQAFERWSIERLKAKRKNSASFELYHSLHHVAANPIQLSFEKSCGCFSTCHPTGPSLRSGLLVSRKQEWFSSNFPGWFVYHLQGIPVKREATGQEQPGEIRGVNVLHLLWIKGSHGKALLPNANKCDFFIPFIFINHRII